MAELKNRVVVVDQIYHQAAGEMPSCVESRFSFDLEQVEQVYARRITLDEQWIALDTGWLNGAVSFVVLENLEGTGLQTIPTEKEQADINRRVVEIGCWDGKDTGHSVSYIQAVTVPFLSIFPTESDRFRPVDPSYVLLRCRSGTARILLHVYPR